MVTYCGVVSEPSNCSAPEAPPAAQTSVVHDTPSLQTVTLGVKTQVPPEQVSSVHGSPSLHTTGVPAQAPPEHTSPPVHGLPSLHEAVLSACAQPVAGRHESSVHGLASSHEAAAPGTQTPCEQASLTVQALPSVQAVPLGALGFEQGPFAGLQVPATWH
jgi:hypothetical protein